MAVWTRGQDWLAMNDRQGCNLKICSAFQLRRETVCGNVERKYQLSLYNGKWVWTPVGSEESSAMH